MGPCHGKGCISGLNIHSHRNDKNTALTISGPSVVAGTVLLKLFFRKCTVCSVSVALKSSICRLGEHLVDW